jgi:hypothetical protein
MSRRVTPNQRQSETISDVIASYPEFTRGWQALQCGVGNPQNVNVGRSLTIPSGADRGMYAGQNSRQPMNRWPITCTLKYSITGSSWIAWPVRILVARERCDAGYPATTKQPPAQKPVGLAATESRLKHWCTSPLALDRRRKPFPATTTSPAHRFSRQPTAQKGKGETCWKLTA